MLINETKVNKNLNLDNRESTLLDFSKKILEESKELAKEIEIFELTGKNLDYLFGELLDLMLVTLSTYNKTIKLLPTDGLEEALEKHHQKLLNRGWNFGGYWEVIYTTENRKKAIQTYTDIAKAKNDKYYRKEVNGYVRNKIKNGIKESEV